MMERSPRAPVPRRIDVAHLPHRFLGERELHTVRRTASDMLDQRIFELGEGMQARSSSIAPSSAHHR